MGFYCILEQPDTLKRLDGWMLSMVRRAMVRRKNILNLNYARDCPTPTNAALATGNWLNPEAWREGDLPESQMPSLVRGWRAARKHYYTFGLEHVEAPNYLVYKDPNDPFTF